MRQVVQSWNTSFQDRKEKREARAMHRRFWRHLEQAIGRRPSRHIPAEGETLELVGGGLDGTEFISCGCVADGLTVFQLKSDGSVLCREFHRRPDDPTKFDRRLEYFVWHERNIILIDEVWPNTAPTFGREGLAEAIAALGAAS